MATTVYTIHRDRVRANDEYQPIALRVDAGQTPAQIRHALAKLLAYFQIH